MKYLLMTLAVVMLFAGSALADQGNLSQTQMAKLGLSGMTVMSDAQGTAVRGMGGSLTLNILTVIQTGSWWNTTTTSVWTSGTINGQISSVASGLFSNGKLSIGTLITVK